MLHTAPNLPSKVAGDDNERSECNTKGVSGFETKVDNQNKNATPIGQGCDPVWRSKGEYGRRGSSIWIGRLSWSTADPIM